MLKAESGGTGSGGTTTPGGVNGQLQYNKAGAFNSYDSFTSPNIAIGSAGTGATASISGTDVAGVITVTSGTPIPNGTSSVATITFGTAFANAPKFIQLTPMNVNAAAAPCYIDVASISTTQFVLTSGAAGLVASSSPFKFSYQVTA